MLSRIGRYYESVSVADSSDIIESLGGSPVSQTRMSGSPAVFSAPTQGGY